MIMMNKLKERRQEAGLTQAALAAATGLSARTIQHYEQGALDLNKAAAITVYRLACALDCRVCDLLELSEDEVILN